MNNASISEKSFSSRIIENRALAEVYLNSLTPTKQLKELNSAAADFIFGNIQGSFKGLIWTLEKGADINQPLSQGQTLIHKIFSTSLDVKTTETILNILLSFGADIEAKTKLLINESKQKMVKTIIPGYRFPCSQELGQTPFLLCAQFRNLVGAKILMSHGADITARNDENLGFLEIYGLGIHLHFPHDVEGELLRWFVSTHEGQKQMVSYLEKKENKEKLIEFFPDFTLSWIATQEKMNLDKNLNQVGVSKSILRL